MGNSRETLRVQILKLIDKYYEEAFPRKRFIPGKTPVPVSGRVFDAEEIKHLVDASLDCWLTTGRFAVEFEKRFAEWVGVKHCSLVNSGSSASLLALTALTSPKLGRERLKPGDEVITVAAGFPTTVNPIIQNRLVPVFADVKIPNYNIDTAQLKKALSPKTRAISIAHTLGNPFDASAVMGFARKHGLWVIEDCCDALGSLYKGKKTGTFGDISTFSFYPAHHMSCSKDTTIPFLNEKNEWRLENIEDVYCKYVKFPEKIKVISFDKKGRVGWTSPSGILRHKVGSKAMVRIVSEHGRYVDVTVDHSVFVLEFDTGCVVPKQASEIKKGDYIVAANNIPALSSLKHINLLEYFRNKNAYISNFPRAVLKQVQNADYRWQYKDRNTLPLKYMKDFCSQRGRLMVGIAQSHKIPASIKIDEGLCRLIGYFLAEGSYQNGIIFSFGAHENDLIEDVVKLSSSIFGITPRLRKNSAGKGINIEVESKNVEIVFKEAFGIRGGADKKRIPSFLYHCNAACIKAFVYAYTRGDGSIRLLKDNTTRIDVTSVSPQILNDFQYLLSRIGISASFYRRNRMGTRRFGKVSVYSRPNYSLCFSGYVYKGKTIARSNLKNRNDVSDQIPLLPIYRQYISLNKNQVTISRTRLLKHLKKGTPAYNLAKSNLAFLKVRETQRISYKPDEFVYDFSVPKKENFYGGFLGIFMHNTMGEGGAVLTGDTKLKTIIESFRDWGRDCWCPTGCDNTCGRRFEWKLGDLPKGYDHKYIYSHIGYNLKLTDMQAAVGCSQLDKLPAFIRKRRENFEYLYKGLKPLEKYLILPETTPHSKPSWFGFPITVKESSPIGRNELVQFLENRKIGTRLLFGGNLTRQPAYKDAKYRKVGSLKESDRVMNRTFWIGVYPGLTREMLDYVIGSMQKALLRN